LPGPWQAKHADASVIDACTLSFGRGGYFFGERKKRSPTNTSANIINPSVLFTALFYHKPEGLREKIGICGRESAYGEFPERRMEKREVHDEVPGPHQELPGYYPFPSSPLPGNSLKASALVRGTKRPDRRRVFN
jgi:hypothetical protein